MSCDPGNQLKSKYINEFMREECSKYNDTTDIQTDRQTDRRNTDVQESLTTHTNTLRHTP